MVSSQGIVYLRPRLFRVPGLCRTRSHGGATTLSPAITLAAATSETEEDGLEITEALRAHANLCLGPYASKRIEPLFNEIVNLAPLQIGLEPSESRAPLGDRLRRRRYRALPDLRPTPEIHKPPRRVERQKRCDAQPSPQPFVS